MSQSTLDCFRFLLLMISASLTGICKAGFTDSHPIALPPELALVFSSSHWEVLLAKQGTILCCVNLACELQTLHILVLPPSTDRQQQWGVGEKSTFRLAVK